MKVLLINGSPHKEGCTYTALSTVEEQLKANGIETQMIQIGTKAVRGCIACGKCKSTGKCAFDDDAVNEAVEAMKSCDGLVVGSPVYYASPNGSILSFLDRMFFAGNDFSHKPAAAVVSARRGGTTASLEVLTKYFGINQMPIVSSNYWNMVHGSYPDDVKKDLEGMQIMRMLGNNMAWMLKCIEAGKKSGVECPAGEDKIYTNFIR